MEASFTEMPLALFTTLASLGAGGFIGLCVALFCAKFTPDQLKRIDRMTIVPLVLVLAGFVAAFFHLANPTHSFGVFAGVGASPLSNEIAAGCLFTVVAIVYVAMGFAGKLTNGARKGLCVATALLAVAFALMMGAAYMMDTIVSWNTPLVPLQMLGFTLAGGIATASLALALAGASEAVAQSPFKTVGLVLFIVGIGLGIGCLAAQAQAVAGMENALYAGAPLAEAAKGYIAAGAVGLVAAAVCCALALWGKAPVALSGAAVVLAFAGILCARLAFYGLQLSVGLSLL